jgi:hypothetical protein
MHCCTIETEAVGAQCATMTLDDSSATITYVWWCEEHFWNVSELQTVHVSNTDIYTLLIS